jgi:hypothetical protein
MNKLKKQSEEQKCSPKWICKSQTSQTSNEVAKWGAVLTLYISLSDIYDRKSIRQNLCISKMAKIVYKMKHITQFWFPAQCIKLSQIYFFTSVWKQTKLAYFAYSLVRGKSVACMPCSNEILQFTQQELCINILLTQVYIVYFMAWQ